MYLGSLFKPLKVAFISTYPPRRCGIATYTADLTGNFRQLYGGSNHNDDPHIFEVIALNNRPQGYRYGREVSFHIRDQHRGDYQRAADLSTFRPLTWFACSMSSASSAERTAVISSTCCAA